MKTKGYYRQERGKQAVHQEAHEYYRGNKPVIPPAIPLLKEHITGTVELYPGADIIADALSL